MDNVLDRLDVTIISCCSIGILLYVNRFYVSMHASVRTYARVCLRACVRPWMCACMRGRACMCSGAGVCVCVRACVCASQEDDA